MKKQTLIKTSEVEKVGLAKSISHFETMTYKEKLRIVKQLVPDFCDVYTHKDNILIYNNYEECFDDVAWFINCIIEGLQQTKQSSNISKSPLLDKLKGKYFIVNSQGQYVSVFGISDELDIACRWFGNLERAEEVKKVLEEKYDTKLYIKVGA